MSLVPMYAPSRSGPATSSRRQSAAEPPGSELDAAGEGPVHQQVGAGDETGGRAGQEYRGPSDLLRSRHPPGGVQPQRRREQLGIAVLDVLPDAAGEVGVARGQAVGPDALGRELIGEALRVVDDRRL